MPDTGFPAFFFERIEFRLSALNRSLKSLVISRIKQRDLPLIQKSMNQDFEEWGRKERELAHVIVQQMHNFLCLFLIYL